MEYQQYYSNWIPGQIQYFDLHVLKAQEQYLLNHVSSLRIQGNVDKSVATKLNLLKYQKYDKVYEQIYQRRSYGFLTFMGRVGTIDMFPISEADTRFCVNLFCQIFPEDPYMFYPKDSHEMRLRYFTSCLNKVYKIKGLKEYAVAEEIGCTYTSDWYKYYNVLAKFAKKYPQVRVVLALDKKGYKITEKMAKIHGQMIPILKRK